MPARSIFNVSNTGQSPYSTTLFAAYGLPFRFRKRKPANPEFEARVLRKSWTPRRLVQVRFLQNKLFKTGVADYQGCLTELFDTSRTERIGSAWR
jgi:hypothetical protein